MEVVARRDIRRDERGVEHGVVVESAVDVEGADRLQRGVEVDVALQDVGSPIDVGLCRRQRVRQHRLADAEERPYRSGRGIALEDAPEVVDVRDADDIDPRRRRRRRDRVHRRDELRMEGRHARHRRFRRRADIVATDEDGHVVDSLIRGGRQLAGEVDHFRAALCVVEGVSGDGRLEREQSTVVAVDRAVGARRP